MSLELFGSIVNLRPGRTGNLNAEASGGRILRPVIDFVIVSNRCSEGCSGFSGGNGDLLITQTNDSIFGT